MEDLCPGPVAGIDEGDKIRTICDGSVGGANDTIRNQTVERSDGAGWGTSSSLATCGSCGGIWSNLHPRAGYGRSRAPGGCCSRRTSPKAHWRKDWRFQVASLVGTYGMASAQSYWGHLGSPSTQGPLRTFPPSGLELRLCG